MAGTFGRYEELPLDKMTAEQRAGYDYIVEGRGSMLGPYKIWMHNPKLLRAASPLGQHFTPDSSSLTEREREIAVIVITHQLRSDYPGAAHEKRGKEIGLGDATVEAMAAGLPASFTDPKEQLVYEVAVSLANNRIVSQGLYDRAVKVLGHERITDMIVLMAYYTAVSLTMNFYAVPAGTPGLAR
ncbi:MAG: carboxymuconolactone decarboxylase [Acetobacteraceae bacterium]|nr:carboxymuconolactone decarboxylase [Acetobacteraceae bacterium]